MPSSTTMPREKRKPMHDMTLAEIKALATTSDAAPIAGAQSIDVRELVLTVNNGLSTGVGMRGEQVISMPGPVVATWYHLVDNLPDLPAFASIQTEPGAQANHQRNEIYVSWSASGTRAGAIRIRVFTLHN